MAQEKFTLTTTKLFLGPLRQASGQKFSPTYLIPFCSCIRYMRVKVKCSGQ